MGLLRSEVMKSGTLLLPVQGAKTYVERLGRNADIQFEDMNAREMRRPYRKYVQRIDEMERILRFVTEEVNKLSCGKIVKNHVDEFFQHEGNVYKFGEVEDELKRMYEVYQKFKENNTQLLSQRSAAEEELEVVKTAKSIYGGERKSSSSASLEAPLLDESERKVGIMAGVVVTIDQMKFERALWRATRGNAYADFFPIQGQIVCPKEGVPKFKSVFVIFFQGLERSAMQAKVQKVCQAFAVNQYKWPSTAAESARAEYKLKKDLRDKNETYLGFQKLMENEAEDILAPAIPGGNSKLEDWRLYCMKEKSIYNVLNQCKGDINLQIDIWYPADDEAKIQSLLKSNSMELSGHLLPDSSNTSKGMPPTFLRVNDYTEGWQEVIVTYGTPKYREANPALLTTVTFPFIFGMMYGDVGHGTLLLLTGVYLVQNAEGFKYDVPAAYMARYMVLAMGIFATFAGFMYNDFFSVGLQIFPSSFEHVGGGQYQPKEDYHPYPFGLDWAWCGATNELLYVNSLKMKLSVLFGVLQMTVGVFLKWSNAIYERNFTDFFFECIPMLMFMLCFFGFMDVMILYKWTHPIDNPPSIINSLICMAMGQEDKFPLWDGSVELAQKLMKYTALAVPWMLLPKPFILLFQHKQAEKKKAANPLLDEEGGGGHGEHGEEFEFGEVFIHQIIETIEFVLGTVSHTASYLRVWALSLAHQQLSLVFFSKTLTMGFNLDFPANGIAIYMMFAAWFGITLGVLMGMDVLECFLHTLRLHWVEFQSKFYKAGGEMFASFNIEKLLRAPIDD
jgi:V-type H+-transporting ATPase subunit a